jgi:hypothetical protein
LALGTHTRSIAMDCSNDWDLQALVRSCGGGNRSVQHSRAGADAPPREEAAMVRGGGRAAARPRPLRRPRGPRPRPAPHALLRLRHAFIISRDDGHVWAHGQGRATAPPRRRALLFLGCRCSRRRLQVRASDGPAQEAAARPQGGRSHSPAQEKVRPVHTSTTAAFRFDDSQLYSSGDRSLMI